MAVLVALILMEEIEIRLLITKIVIIDKPEKIVRNSQHSLLASEASLIA